MSWQVRAQDLPRRVGGGNGPTVTKTGAGSAILSGANTYSGGTTVNAGTLALSGSGTLGGTSGALAIGAVLATIAVIVRQEIVLAIMGGIFVVEAISVMAQVSYFKYTKRKLGEGKRIFLKSPLHHHYQKLGYHESKIVTRFWIVTVLCVVFSIVTLKIR